MTWVRNPAEIVQKNLFRWWALLFWKDFIGRLFNASDPVQSIARFRPTKVASRDGFQIHTLPGLFSRRFRDGSSFPNFVERGPSRNCPSPSSVMCLCSTEQSIYLKLERNADDFGCEFWAWIFLGRPEALEKQGWKIRAKNSLQKFAEKFAGNSAKTSRTKLKSSPQIRSAEPSSRVHA